MKLPQNLRCSRGLLEPDAWKAGTSGSEGAPAQQCVGATRRYTFRARLTNSRRGFFANFSPAMSVKAKKAKGQQIRAWRLNRRSGMDLSSLAEDINPQVRGWINYYGAFYRSELSFLALRIDQHLMWNGLSSTAKKLF